MKRKLKFWSIIAIMGALMLSVSCKKKKEPPQFTSQPTNVTVTAGGNTTFTVAVTGDPIPTLQWQSSPNGTTWSDISGATSTTLTLNAVTEAMNGSQYRCTATNSAGIVNSNAATLTVNPAPVSPQFTTQPVSVTVGVGGNATFTVAATGNPAPTLQWQSSTDGTTWSNINGATSATYTITGVTAAMNGTRYRCVATNSAGTVNSSAATLTAGNTLPQFTTQPANVTAKLDGNVTFTVAATGYPAPTYQWQSSSDGTTWSNISGARSTTYTITGVTAAMSGTRYRCVATNVEGSVNSSPATLTIEGIFAYNLGEIVIRDGMTATTQNSEWPNGITGYLPIETISLTPMFNYLTAESVTTWKSSSVGAANLSTILTDATFMQGTTNVNTSFKGVSTSAVISFTKSNGDATTSQTDAANIVLKLNYSTGSTSQIDGGSAGTSFQPGKPYSVTIVFKNAQNVVLNTIIINFTPVLPDFSSYLVKDAGFWNADKSVLHAYFKESLPKAEVQDWKPAVYNIIADGGFTTAGSRYTRNYLGLSLSTDLEQGGTGDNNINNFIRSVSDATPLVVDGTTSAASPNFAQTVRWGMGQTSGGSFTLYNGAPGTTNRAENRYYGDNAGSPINIKVEATKYLNIYPVDLDGELDFKLRLASAVESGGIKPVGANIVLPVTSVSQQFKLTKENITGYNYINSTYSVFPEWIQVAGGAYKSAFNYTYIRSVEFTIPPGVTHYTLTGEGGIPLVDNKPVPAKGDADGKNPKDSWVGITVSNLSQTVNTFITVTVTDVFGFKTSIDVPITLQRP